MFGGISKAFTTSINGTDLQRILGSVAPAATGAIGPVLEHIEKLLGGISMNGAAGQVAQKLATGGQSVNLEQLGPALAKMAYIAVLMEAIEDAKGKPNFNVETAINDLWTKLGRVRPQVNQPFKTGLADVLQKVGETMRAESLMIQKAIQNIK